jgi:uncharacterized protein (TIGR02118 family)
MDNTPVLHIVGVRCEPQIEEKFVKWYNEVHIPLLLKFKGLKKATCTRAIKRSEEYPEYLSIFEFDNKQAFLDYEKSPELAAAAVERDETWKEGGWDRMWRVQYEVLKTWST